MKNPFSLTIGLVLYMLSVTTVLAQSTDIRPGLVLPQMTTAQRTSIGNPANGSLIFDTNTQSYWYRQSGVWVELPKGGSTANYWQLSGLGGNEITHTNSGGFWSKNPVGLTASSDNTSNPPTVPIDEAGTRLMWIPNRSAFRVGTFTAASLASATGIGLFSFGAGFNVFALGKYSTAIGYDANAQGIASLSMGMSTSARGDYATSLGYYSSASGEYSTAMGYQTFASGNASTAMGYNTFSRGLASTAMGNYTNANGSYSTAMGNYTRANGLAAIAMGNYTNANADNSTAMGSWVNINGQRGAFTIGDSDPNGEGETLSGAADQFVARFKNGYYLLTSGDDIRTGASMIGGQTAWNAISDSTRKEKLILADGESFLIKLRNLKLGSWNYKGKTTNPERFYGPMAQELFTAFGKDKYGTIGSDTTVSTLNMDGLLFIFSQALEKRTQDLQVENDQLKAIIQRLDARLETLEVALDRVHQPQVKAKTDR